MKSYAVVDQIVGKWAVLEVELVGIDSSKTIDFKTKATNMIDIPYLTIKEVVGDVIESDVIVVEHDFEEVLKVYYKDDEEKQRRIEILRQILQS